MLKRGDYARYGGFIVRIHKTWQRPDGMAMAAGGYGREVFEDFTNRFEPMAYSGMEMPLPKEE
jgi:hypothetical protein